MVVVVVMCITAYHFLLKRLASESQYACVAFKVVAFLGCGVFFGRVGGVLHTCLRLWCSEESLSRSAATVE